MKKKLFLAISLLLVFVFVLAACRQEAAVDTPPTPAPSPAPADPTPPPAGQDDENGQEEEVAQVPEGVVIPAGHPINEMFAVLENFPEFIDRGNAHVAGTTLNLGVALGSPWNGLIGGAIFHDDTTDAFLAGPLGTNLSVF